MSLFTQLYPLCPHSHMHCPSFLPPWCHQLSAFLTPMWGTHSILLTSSPPRLSAWLRSVSVFQCCVSCHLCVNLPNHPGYSWPFDEWPISSRQNQPHCGCHLLPSPTLPGGHLPGLWRQSIPADPRHGTGCKPGYGGHGAGGNIYLPFTTTVLEEICRWHVHSTPPQPGWLLPWPSEQYRPVHPVHEREGVRRSALLPWHPPEQRGRWLQLLCVPKATHTDQYLCFHSHHPAAHKRTVVRTLICRTEALSSSGVSRVQEGKLVSQAFSVWHRPPMGLSYAWVRANIFEPLRNECQ